MPQKFILASTSPRRQALLKQLNIPFEAVAIDIDETPLANESAADYVERLAVAKARAGLQGLDEHHGVRVLGADTCIALDDKIYGKPQNQQQGYETLRALSGREHHVLTGVAVVSLQHTHALVQCSQVRFKTLTDEEIAAYWATGEPHDKAGAYAIQGLGAAFIEHIAGSYSGIMGLPLFETKQLYDNSDDALCR